MKRIFKLIFLLAFLLLFTSKLQAQTDSTRIRTTPEMRAEAYEQYELSGKKVAKLHLDILNYLGSVKNKKAAAYKKSYSASQLGWENYRSGHCQIISDQSSDAPTGPDQFFYQCVGRSEC